jgi:hypothetical protein
VTVMSEDGEWATYALLGIDLVGMSVMCAVAGQPVSLLTDEVNFYVWHPEDSINGTRVTEATVVSKLRNRSSSADSR